MKHLKIIPAIILSFVLINNELSVNADSSIGNSEYDADTEVEIHDGYSFVAGQFATSFNSYEDYAEHYHDASESIGSGYPMSYYFENYDYIYLPTYLMDSVEDITCIFVTPRYVRVTYSIDGEEMDFYHYFLTDGEDSCEDFELTGGKIEVDGIIYYKIAEAALGEKAYCCNYDNSYFVFTAETDLENMGAVPFTKVYADSSIGEENGQLYCYNDSGEKESGWKEINGHSYYFRSSDKTAICGKAAKIGDVVYKFNDNGICKGKFTGYATQSDGSRVYYKDGVQTLSSFIHTT